MLDPDQDAIAAIVAKLDAILGDDALSGSLRARLMRWRTALVDGWSLPPLRPVERV